MKSSYPNEKRVRFEKHEIAAWQYTLIRLTVETKLLSRTGPLVFRDLSTNEAEVKLEISWFEWIQPEKSRDSHLL